MVIRVAVVGWSGVVVEAFASRCACGGCGCFASAVVDGRWDVVVVGTRHREVALEGVVAQRFSALCAHLVAEF